MPTLTSTIESYGITDVGLRRASNQDEFLIAQIRHPVPLQQASFNPKHDPPEAAIPLLLAVADGMGGHNHGEMASRIAIEGLHDYVARHWRDFLSAGEGMGGTVTEHLRAAFRHAHQKVTDMSCRNPSLRDMGTTLTAAFVFWPQLYVGHAGDSRCCLLRRGHLHQITTDQTVANLPGANLVGGRSGGDEAPPPTEIPSMTHVLYNCLGAGIEQLDVECHQWELEPTDRILLCSDGLTRHVRQRRITEILGGASSTIAACCQLVESANRAGGTDNITVVVAQRLEAHPPVPPPLPGWSPLADTDRHLSSGGGQGFEAGA